MLLSFRSLSPSPRLLLYFHYSQAPRPSPSLLSYSRNLRVRVQYFPFFPVSFFSNTVRSAPLFLFNASLVCLCSFAASRFFILLRYSGIDTERRITTGEEFYIVCLMFDGLDRSTRVCGSFDCLFGKYLYPVKDIYT